MDKVQRYDVNHYSDYGYRFEKDDIGTYVTYKDYKKLADSIPELELSLKYCGEEVKKFIKENERLEKLIPEWINHYDRQPEEGQEVYYYFETTGVSEGEYTKDGDCFYGDKGFLCGDVSHWMPRNKPQPPDSHE